MASSISTMLGNLAKLLFGALLVIGAIVLIGGVAVGVSAITVATVRGDRIDEVCRIGDELTRTKVLDQAQIAYQAVLRADGDATCPTSESEAKLGPDMPEEAAEARVEHVRTLQSRRDTKIEEARVRRAIAGREPHPRIRRRGRLAAKLKYLEGLRVEPYSEGARRGLRFVLRGLYPSPRGAPEARICQPIDELAASGLVAEARVVYVRALDHKGSPQCDPSFGKLRNLRKEGIKHLRTARAQVRAGNTRAARTEYLQALEKDPSLTTALAGLDALPLPRIERDRGTHSDVWSGIEAAAAWIARNAVAFALFLAAALLLAKLVWWSLGKAGDASVGVNSALDGIPPLRRLTKEHIEIVTTEPLTGEEGQLVDLIRQELNTALVGAAAPTRKILATETSPFELVHGAARGGGFTATALTVSPALGPLGGAAALLPQVATKRQSRLLLLLGRDSDGKLSVDWRLRDSKGNERRSAVDMAEVRRLGLSPTQSHLARVVAGQVRTVYR